MVSRLGSVALLSGSARVASTQHCVDLAECLGEEAVVDAATATPHYLTPSTAETCRLVLGVRCSRSMAGKFTAVDASRT